MSSAFRRAGAKKTAAANKASPLSASSSLFGARGVKPWAGGIHLTSVGLNDLDTILGGGQPLGTCILLQEDRFTRDLALSLVKYWCAEVCPQKKEGSDGSVESLAWVDSLIEVFLVCYFREFPKINT
jgi:hypothetical protein